MRRGARRSRRPRTPTTPSRCCCWRSPSCCWRAAGWARSPTWCRTSGSSRTPGSTRTSRAARRSLANLLEPIDEHAALFDPYADEPEVFTCRLSDDIADVMSDLLHGLQHYRAGRAPRRCGGGSSPTCPTGARPRARRCARCTRSSPTSGWTPRWTTRSGSRTACSPRPSPRSTSPDPPRRRRPHFDHVWQATVLPEACAPRNSADSPAIRGRQAAARGTLGRGAWRCRLGRVRVSDCPARGRVRP